MLVCHFHVLSRSALVLNLLVLSEISDHFIFFVQLREQSIILGLERFVLASNSLAFLEKEKVVRLSDLRAVRNVLQEH